MAAERPDDSSDVTSDVTSGGVPVGPVVMVTGHRTVHHPELVRGRLGRVVDKMEPRLAVSGGAEGADSLWASAALLDGVPLRLVLPNRWYRSRYRDSVTDEVCAAAHEVVFAVDRPDVPDWRARWDVERWWVDNHVRNKVMVVGADVVVVVSDRAPRSLVGEPKGGTASCVREVLRHHGDGCKVVWVPDRVDVDVCWDTLRRLR